jgi:hypothetical protein
MELTTEETVAVVAALKASVKLYLTVERNCDWSTVVKDHAAWDEIEMVDEEWRGVVGHPMVRRVLERVEVGV